MKKLSKYVVLLLLLTIGNIAYADEGMWLLQLMQEQHSIDMMKKQGLHLNAIDIYNPNDVSLKDAVGIFGRGCTGEIISSEGLILTNHHCGYESIQQHSTVEHDYLANGFWAKSKNEELETPGLTFKFVDKIIDITDQVNADIKAKKITEIESMGNAYCRKLAEELKNKSEYKNKSYIEAQVLPYYAGNSFYLIYYKVYSDIRMVAAPPSSIGKFGGETDNWMWPRHTCDFSMFRIYADKNGEPAAYNKENTPLKVKKYLTISLKGINEGDYTMIMGFPGRTSRSLTASEVKDRMESINEPRIKVRTAYLDVLKKAMASDEKIRIQYSSKFASSSNYWKNSIGMNKAIVDNNVIETKQKQENAFKAFAENKPEYHNVIEKINEYTQKISKSKFIGITFSETFNAIEFTKVALVCKIINKFKEDITAKNDTAIQKDIKAFKATYDYIHDNDYDANVDRNIAKALIPLYISMVDANNYPDFYEIIKNKYNGDYNKYIDDIFDNSIFASSKNLNKFIDKPTVKALNKDLGLQYGESVLSLAKSKSNSTINAYNDSLSLMHKKYIRGLNEMKLPVPSYPDANFTMRLTYGNVKSYRPKDGVIYKYYTTTEGVLQKEDPTNPEFVVPEKLKQLIEKKDFGRYAMPDGEMPACFLTTNDITGGNSGSPVMNADGELIGAAFDGNWESLSGDISFDNNLQRCIVVDIRYILFVLDKFGGCNNLINEMTFAQ